VPTMPKAIADGQGEGKTPAEDLVSMEGMTDELAARLAAQGITTRDDLGEQSVDELMVVDDMDEELAGKLIMKARESWFAEAEAAEAEKAQAEVVNANGG